VRCREHVELAGIGRRPFRIGDGENDVRPVLPAFNDACRAAAERCQRPLVVRMAL
jgi:hypothetical protein